MAESLREQHCRACEGGIPPLDEAACRRQLTELDARWQLMPPNLAIQARFCFRNFHQVMAFVNAVADVAHQQDHHPEIQLAYRECTVSWTTHAASGLTLNDFICAARTDALLSRPTPEHA